MTRLAKSELLLFALLALHTVDHAVNQPARDLPAGSGLVGIAGFALVAVAIVFALFRSSYSAEVGLFAGAGTVIGFVAVHLPGFGPLADPFPDFDPNALSWILRGRADAGLGLGRGDRGRRAAGAPSAPRLLARRASQSSPAVQYFPPRWQASRGERTRSGASSRSDSGTGREAEDPLGGIYS